MSGVKKNDFPVAAKVIDGGFAGIVGVTCTFPIDLVKTRLQKQRIGKDGKAMYSGLWDCFKKTWTDGYKQPSSVAQQYLGGVKALYQGYAVNVTLITAEKAIKLTVNDALRHYLAKSDGQLTLIREVAAGGGAGMCQIVVTTPMEFLKIQLQDAGRAVQRGITSAAGARVGVNLNGSVSVAAKPTVFQIFSERGPAGFVQTIYKGFVATMMRDVSFSMVYFPLFAYLNSLGPRKQHGKEAAWYWSLGSGITAGGASALVVNPVDVVKTRLQVLNPVPGERVYSGIPDAFISVLREEGVGAFFKGAYARMIVIAPLFGIAQAVYYIGVGDWVLSKLR